MSRVLLFCLDQLSASMAGPAIRYWELAKALSLHHQVTLSTIFPVEIKSPDFAIASTTKISLKELIKNHDVIIVQEVSLQLAYHAKRLNKSIILDHYDPMPLEILEYMKHESMPYQKKLHQRALDRSNFSLKMADRVICASPVQRTLWTGFMAALGLINPETYANLKMEIAPFGLNSTAPKKQGPGLREKFHFRETDFVMIWGGGIWNWFDPLTLIRALHSISKTRSDVKLVFMGTKHPNPGIPKMKMTKDAIELANELGLYNRAVFFNEGWIPYDQRQNFLMDADLGVSMHYDNLETTFSFRTRLLDYLWADLPIVSTKGDFFADLIEKEKLGICVESENIAELEKAILRMVENPQERALFKQNIQRVKPQFYWEKIADVIHRIIGELVVEKKCKSLSEYLLLVKYILRTIPIRIATKGLSLIKRLKKQEA